MTDLTVRVDWDHKGVFLSRPNRFLALVDIDGEDEPCEVHVHDPGRLEEILFPGNQVLVRRANRPGRRTRWDLIAGRVGKDWILVNSSIHRYISEALLSRPDLNPFGCPASLRPEVKLGRSRIDFLMREAGGKDVYIEVKGCSLTVNEKALFPDAPTARGMRHVEELISLIKKGNRGGILILVLGPRAECFSPNFKTDPGFYSSFMEGVRCGLEVHPVVFRMKGLSIEHVGEIPLCPGILSK